MSPDLAFPFDSTTIHSTLYTYKTPSFSFDQHSVLPYSMGTSNYSNKNLSLKNPSSIQTQSLYLRIFQLLQSSLAYHDQLVFLLYHLKTNTVASLDQSFQTYNAIVPKLDVSSV